jgi:hypothetical protein
MNDVDNASKPPTISRLRPTTTTTTTTKTTMERQEEARQQEEARRHDKQRQQCIKTANYVDVETDDRAAGGGTAAGEGAARDK